MIKNLFLIKLDLGVKDAKFSQYSERLASASKDTTFRLWALDTGALQNRLDSHDYRANTVTVLLDAKRLALASTDRTI